MIPIPDSVTDWSSLLRPPFSLLGDEVTILGLVWFSFGSPSGFLSFPPTIIICPAYHISFLSMGFPLVYFARGSPGSRYMAGGLACLTNATLK